MLCVSLCSFSQEDEGMILLEDSDDNRILFENHFFEALKYKAIGNFSRAITELEKCQQLFPNDDSIEFELSKNHFSLNNYSEARLYIEKALISKPENIWYLNKAKAIYMKQYEYEKAIEVQHEIITLQPNKKEDLVLIYILSNKKEEAQTLLDKLNTGGITSLKLRSYQKALSNTRKQNPTQKEVATKDLSLDALKKSFENKKQFDVLKEILQQEYTSQNIDELEKYSAISLELFPAHPLGYLMQGYLFNFKKKYNEAIGVLNEGLDFIVDDNMLEADFYEQFALSFEGLNQVQNANKAKEKALQLRKN